MSLKYIEIYSPESNRQYASIRLDNGLLTNRRYARIWFNNGPVHWRIYVSFSLDELTKGAPSGASFRCSVLPKSALPDKKTQCLLPKYQVRRTGTGVNYDKEFKCRKWIKTSYCVSKTGIYIYMYLISCSCKCVSQDQMSKLKESQRLAFLTHSLSFQPSP